MIGLLFSVLTVMPSWASQHFTPLRFDQSVPEHCQDMKIQFYSLPAQTMIIGRKGAVEMGYTLEYPIDRGHAQILWRFFRKKVQGEVNQSLLSKIKKHPDMKRDYEIINSIYQEQGFEFINEGEILEALVINHLYSEFPENHYYITGGVKYHDNPQSLTIGEIDLFIGLREDCSSVVIGEVKLGRYVPLKKARHQLERFEDFLLDNNASHFGGEFRPSSQKLLPKAS